MKKHRHHAITLTATALAVLLTLAGCDKSASTTSTPASSAAAGAPAVATTPAYTPPTAQQLEQLVAPIALFPDKLVAQVLAGSTYPDQVSAANQWLTQNPALKGDILQAAEDKQPWDVSVKSLTQFPAVLSQMAGNPDWTRQLGDAFVNDPNDVMNAIQTLRLRAQQAGNLRNSAQLRVASTVRTVEATRYVSAPGTPEVYTGAPVVPPPPQTIVIESAQPDTVYVPHYDPAVVYGGPVPVYPGYTYRPPSHVASEVVVGALSFGVGIFVGEAISHHGDWGWHDWGMHWGAPVEHDRPSGDWQRPAVVYKNNTYVSHSTTVINRVTNNVTVNNNRVTNNNVNNVTNVSNVNNINNARTVNNIDNQRNTTNNLREVNNNTQTRIDNHAPQAMSMPHFTAADARPGALPAAPRQAGQEHTQAPAMQAAMAAQTHAGQPQRALREEKAAHAPQPRAEEAARTEHRDAMPAAPQAARTTEHAGHDQHPAAMMAPAQPHEAPQSRAIQGHANDKPADHHDAGRDNHAAAGRNEKTVEKTAEKAAEKAPEKREEKREDKREEKREDKHDDKKAERKPEAEKHNG